MRRGIGVVAVAAAGIAAVPPAVASDADDARREAAADALSDALKDDPADAAALRALDDLSVDCLEAGDLRTGKYCTALLYRLQPQREELRSRMVRVCIARGDLEEAEEVLREWIRVRPSTPEAHAELADLLSRLGRHRHALDAWEALLRERPDSARALDARARILAWDLHDYEGARREIERMRTVAAREGIDPARARWLREDAEAIDGIVSRLERERGTLASASLRLRRWTAWSAVLLLAAFAGGWWATSLGRRDA